jgi:hypothetical protein
LCDITLTLVEEGDAIVGEEGLELHGLHSATAAASAVCLCLLRLPVARRGFGKAWRPKRFFDGFSLTMGCNVKPTAKKNFIRSLKKREFSRYRKSNKICSEN